MALRPRCNNVRKLNRNCPKNDFDSGDMLDTLKRERM